MEGMKKKKKKYSGPDHPPLIQEEEEEEEGIKKEEIDLIILIGTGNFIFSVLQNREEEILHSLGACLQCFGGHSSTEVDGSLVYNLILEYARRKSEEFDGEAQRLPILEWLEELESRKFKGPVLAIRLTCLSPESLALHEREAPINIWSWDARDPKRRWTADMLMNHPFVVLLLKPKRTPTPMVQSCSSFLPSRLPPVIPSQLSNEVVDRGSKKEDKRRHTEFLGRMVVESYLKRRIVAELL
ncbi:hypothetical protein CK203_045971 [Vitis vinifera]|uniref:Uncharacterized protein n=1 Tax=Vitis vinifera TaxID=29760 RepID=A0A438HGW7_VITVI|nr:hypothetical protein CK203_045971 [Vitis vinifera]